MLIGNSVRPFKNGKVIYDSDEEEELEKERLERGLNQIDSLRDGEELSDTEKEKN